MPAHVDQTFAALADPTRRRVIDLLRGGPRRAGELADAFQISPPALSRHLRVLRATGLVSEERIEDDARVRVYQLRRERFLELSRWLAELEATWDEQLASFRSHVERTRPRPRR